MASFSFAQHSHPRQPNSTPSALNYYTFKCHHLLLSPTPSQRLSNKAPNLLLSYVLYFAYWDGCRILGSCDDAEGLGTPMISWGNLGTSGEFFTMFSTGLVKLLPVSNYEALTFSLTETGYFGSSQPKRIIRQRVLQNW